MSLPSVLRTNARNEDQSLEISSVVIDPLYNSTSLTRFEIPHKNIMDSKSSLIFAVKWTQEGEPTAENDLRPFLNRPNGAISMIKNARLLINGRLVSNLQQAGKYLNMRNYFRSHDDRVNVYDIKYQSNNDWFGPTADEFAMEPVVGKQINTGGDQSLNNSGKLECCIRLDRLFTILRDTQLPTHLIEGKIQIEIEWEADATAGLTNQSECITWAGTDLAGFTANMKGVEVASPRLLIDFLTYNDSVEMALRQQMNSTGLTFAYREVGLVKKFLSGGLADGQEQTTDFAIGFTNRAIQKIFCSKVGTGLSNKLLQTQRSDLFNKEKWNCRINNLNIYDRIVDNSAEAYNYLTQAGEGTFHLPPQAYTERYNVGAGNSNMIQSTEILAVDENGLGTSFDRQNATPFNCALDNMGRNSYIGIDLAKYRRGDEEVYNALRVGSTPVIFRFERTGSADASLSAQDNGAVDFYFWVEYLKKMSIQRGIVDVSDM